MTDHRLSPAPFNRCSSKLSPLRLFCLTFGADSIPQPRPTQQVHRWLPAIPLYLSEHWLHCISTPGIDPFPLLTSQLLSHRLQQRLSSISTYCSCLSRGTLFPHWASPATLPSIDYEWCLPFTLLIRPSFQRLPFRANIGISRLSIAEITLVIPLLALFFLVQHFQKVVWQIEV